MNQETKYTNKHIHINTIYIFILYKLVAHKNKIKNTCNKSVLIYITILAHMHIYKRIFLITVNGKSTTYCQSLLFERIVSYQYIELDVKKKRTKTYYYTYSPLRLIIYYVHFISLTLSVCTYKNTSTGHCGCLLNLLYTSA